MAVLVYVTLKRPPQRQADQRVIAIKPVAKNSIVRIDVSVHEKNLFFYLRCYIDERLMLVKNFFTAFFTESAAWPE
jgi:hypothetical protein